MEELQRCLGGPWPEPCPLNTKVVESDPPGSSREPFERIKLTYEAEPGEEVPAYLLLPRGATAPAPAVVLCHQHAGQYHIGKSEVRYRAPITLHACAAACAPTRPEPPPPVQPAGLAGDPMHHTGAALARHGFVVICPDALCFEEREVARPSEFGATAGPSAEASATASDEGGLRAGGLSGGDLERFEFLRYVVSGRSLAWKSVLDIRRSVDLLVSRPEVDASRIGDHPPPPHLSLSCLVVLMQRPRRWVGIYGHSMGSTHVWLATPHDPRITCAVGNCCMPTYASIERAQLIHCFPNFVVSAQPSLCAFFSIRSCWPLQQPGWRTAERDIPDMVALACPKPLHLNFGAAQPPSPLKPFASRLVGWLRQGSWTTAARSRRSAPA